MLARVAPQRIPLSFLRQRSWMHCKNRGYLTVQGTKVNISRCPNLRSPNSLLIQCLPKSTRVIQNSHVSTEADENKLKLVYEGPLSRPVQLVKVLSLSTALMTMLATPLLMVYGKQSVPMAGKLAIGTTIILAGTSTTFLLHWITKVYVHRMFYNAATEMFVAETMSLFAMKKKTEFSLVEIRLAKEPSAFTTFEAKGKKYFLHSDLMEAQQVLQFIRENRS